MLELKIAKLKKENKDLQNEYQLLIEKNTCKICRKQSSFSCILIECHHVMCNDCGQTFLKKKCPFCQKNVCHIIRLPIEKHHSTT